LQPSYESSSFQVSNCILDLSRRYEDPFRELPQTDDAGIAAEAVREQEEFVIDSFGEGIERGKETVTDGIGNAEFSSDGSTLCHGSILCLGGMRCYGGTVPG
jgi:hypothetical protein